MALKAKEASPADVGVIIGRFQVPSPHSAHVDLIETVTKAHAKVIVFLGLSPIKGGTLENPLDFQMREQMLRERFPDLIVQYIKDCRSDEVWSKNLDRQISDLITPNQKVQLYGSRDSFIKAYKGQYPTIELESTCFVSGTEIRKQARARAKNSEDFRAGVVWQSANRFNTVYTTVDVAVLDGSRSKVLLARKPGESAYRFIGGFADVNSDSFEADARREVMEESHIEITDLKYLGSFKIDDWRYRNEKDKIKSLFFLAVKAFGSEQADDDICEVRYFDVEKLQDKDVMEEHRPLLARLKQHLAGK